MKTGRITRALCVVLSVMMIAALFTAFPTSAKVIKGSNWKLDTKTGLFKGYKDFYYDIEYTKDMPWYKNRNDIKKVVLKDGAGLGMGVFMNCEKIESVQLDPTLTTIDGSAFHSCDSLKRVIICNSVQRIEGAFYNCKKLMAAFIPPSLTELDGCGLAEYGNDVYPYNSKYNKSFTMVCEKGSAADKYAKKHSLKRSYVTLSAYKATLKAGATKALKYTGPKVAAWKSSAKSIAKVDKNGKITALKKGVAIIGANLSNGAVVTCAVKVKNNPSLKIRDKAFDAKKTYSITKGKALTVKIGGKAASVNNKYATTDKKIAKITSKKNVKTVKIQSYKKGTATVKIKVNGVLFKIKVKVK